MQSKMKMLAATALVLFGMGLSIGSRPAHARPSCSACDDYYAECQTHPTSACLARAKNCYNWCEGN